MNCVKFDKEEEKKTFVANLQKALQSSSLNFLIGSGCSDPEIKTLGNVEKELQIKIDQGKSDEVEKFIFEFLKTFSQSTDNLIKGCLDKSVTLKNYKKFVLSIAEILFERKSNIQHKQASIFSTNYDLFVEKACESYSDKVLLNDGFRRTSSLSQEFKYSSSEFFNSIYNTGNLYNYKVEVPSINLVKLHGSLNWQVKGNEIINSLEYIPRAIELKDSTKMEEIIESNDLFSIVLPKKDKFKETLLNQTYYDLLRIYANELDKENTLLIAEGFSFADEHIFEVTKRALKNPTLKLIVFCWDKTADQYIDKFSSYKNVDVVYSESENLDFKVFSEFLGDVLPVKKEAPVHSVRIESYCE